jgi:hypothetical protein
VNKRIAHVFFCSVVARIIPGLSANLRLLTWCTAVVFAPGVVLAQTEVGQLSLEVRDSTGAAVAASIQLLCEANQIHRTAHANPRGRFSVNDLPFGVYRLNVSAPGFASDDRLVEIASQIPVDISLTLGVAAVTTQVEVDDAATLVDPRKTGTVYSVGAKEIGEQLSAQPGRALSDLVNDQPGWLYEANGVLHPRGSEYGIQYVVDGLPVTENRSPAFAPPFQEDDAESLRVRTAGFPAEYGRKLSGVVEVTTAKDIPHGLHGTVVANGGSFSTAGGYLGLGYAAGSNQFSFHADGSSTDRYLDPPVIADYTNHGSFDGFAGAYAHDITAGDRLRVTVAHDWSGFLVPDELLQQDAGQHQRRSDEETSGRAYYQHTISDKLLLNAEASVRDSSATLNSNAFSTPVIADQQRGFREAYARLDLAGQSGENNRENDWKVGADAIFSNVNEALQYQITDASDFDPGTRLNLSFLDHGHDREQSAYAQDQVRLGNWNISAGLRFDHYAFAVDQSAFSPRMGLSRYFSGIGLIVHGAYDRVFQTPAMENLLLASSPLLDLASTSVLRLPVRPARANYYEAGITKSFRGKISFTGNVFRRDFSNYADDDVLLNTGVSFPIAFESATIRGTEAGVEVQTWKGFSGFISYANQTGSGHGPITGGLFLGSDVTHALTDTSVFPVSQDQRNTARARIRYQATPRLWFASGGSYGSGLPVELDNGDSYTHLLSQYGPEVLSKVNFARQRLRPSATLDVAAAFDLYHKENRRAALEVEVFNLADRLNVINFASLFSGTALGPPRSATVQLKTQF